MPKDHFAPERVTALAKIPAGSQIHFIGVCGVAMAPLAIALANLGYQVSGSDKEFYEPMGTLLSESKVRLLRGYAASNISKDCALAVIGNAVSYGHEEVSAVESRGVAYTSSAQLLADLVLRDRHSIVVAGTHGKSTTTALCATTLIDMKQAPGFFVGALPIGLPLGLQVGSGKFSVVEGDEYDTAFFAKVPKFRFYLGSSAIITSIEYDHADIYPDLESIITEFDWLAHSLPKDGYLVCCADCPNLQKLIPKWRESVRASIVTYGVHPESDYRITSASQQGLAQRVVGSAGQESFKYTVPLGGEYNAKNALAVYITLTKLGLGADAVAKGISAYPGIKRRQEIRFDKGDITVIDDFAHHPTAVRETLAGMRKAFPRRRIWAVFEPRSNTSRRKVFQDDYVAAFKSVDRVLLCNVEARKIDAGLELIDVGDLAKAISGSGVEAECLADADKIKARVLSEIKSGDLVIVMSNGGFCGLVGGLVEELNQQAKLN